MYGTVKAPDYFIEPSKEVARRVKETHATWLKTPSRGGSIHNDSTIRKFTDLDEEYLNNWNLLS